MASPSLCPRCKTELRPVTYEHVSIEACRKCDGTWLDAGKLQPILAVHDVIFPPALIVKTLKEAHTGIPKAELEYKLSCPKCAKPMNALNYDYSSGIIIHVCANGQGLWFDKDQLSEVQLFMEHWNQELAQNRAKWSGMAKNAQQEEYARLDAQDAELKKRETPIERTLDSVLYEFEKLGR